LLIDSGSGGVNVLSECVRLCPSCNYLLFCDTKNLPYGAKDKEDLCSITLKNLEDIYRFFKFEIVIFACNTLSCTCLQECRDAYKNITFVGTVPAIKPALEKYDAKDVLVLATPVTTKHNVLLNKHKDLQVLALDFLAKDIDDHLDNLQTLKDKIEKNLKSTTSKAVVLGCTHYRAVKDFIVDALGGNVEVFDSQNGVARRLKSFVEDDKQNCQIQIMVSGDANFLPQLWNFYNMNKHFSYKNNL